MKLLESCQVVRVAIVFSFDHDTGDEQSCLLEGDYRVNEME